MNFWVLLLLSVFLLEVQNGVSQETKSKKDANSRPGRKKGKGRYTKVKDKEVGGKLQSILTQVLEKGRFLRLSDHAMLNSGKTLELRCKGSKIGWAYPSYLDTFNDTRFSIEQNDKFSQLTLKSPSPADTGEYSCWVILCDGDECEKDTDRTSTSYIYFTDKDELFVPSPIHFEIVFMRPDIPATVPCRVTSPKTTVSLHREMPPEEIPADGKLISYNPTKGFILQSPSLEYTGAFYCKAKSTTKTTPQVSNKYQLLYLEVPSGPPYATIQASSILVTGGDLFNITCTVLGEPEIDVKFSWTYPGQDQRPVIIQDSRRLINRGVGQIVRISQSVMIVDDVETIDFGTYICTAKNPHGETSVATQVNLLGY
ncbi:platelet-derived growth factor receptor-like protein precursor [Silurus asotus]|uniref:Platelet-derived growth factor receptor-like protein n=1 Tax=Silurus asotus TaxID=30991 RepID=A0AAD5FVE2_SILAS|nr:platelet-derived growth factor receptor-like protein precursor [Silurus asotus]